MDELASYDYLNDNFKKILENKKMFLENYDKLLKFKDDLDKAIVHTHDFFDKQDCIVTIKSDGKDIIPCTTFKISNDNVLNFPSEIWNMICEYSDTYNFIIQCSYNELDKYSSVSIGENRFTCVSKDIIKTFDTNGILQNTIKLDNKNAFPFRQFVISESLIFTRMIKENIYSADIFNLYNMKTRTMRKLNESNIIDLDEDQIRHKKVYTYNNNILFLYNIYGSKNRTKIFIKKLCINTLNLTSVVYLYNNYENSYHYVVKNKFYMIMYNSIDRCDKLNIAVVCLDSMTILSEHVILIKEQMAKTYKNHIVSYVSDKKIHLLCKLESKTLKSGFYMFSKYDVHKELIIAVFDIITGKLESCYPIVDNSSDLSIFNLVCGSHDTIIFSKNGRYLSFKKSPTTFNL